MTRCSGHPGISQISLHNVARHLLAQDQNAGHIAVQGHCAVTHENLSSSAAPGRVRRQLCCDRARHEEEHVNSMQRWRSDAQHQAELNTGTPAAPRYLSITLASIHWFAVENHQPFLETISEWFTRQRYFCQKKKKKKKDRPFHISGS